MRWKKTESGERGKENGGGVVEELERVGARRDESEAKARMGKRRGREKSAACEKMPDREYRDHQSSR